MSNPNESYRIKWPDFKFPPLNLWNAPPSPEMLALYRHWDLLRSKSKDIKEQI